LVEGGERHGGGAVERGERGARWRGVRDTVGADARA
jgi:hypothetical protein